LRIVFTAKERKKELLFRFCAAYRSNLSVHKLFATSGTARALKETGLILVPFLNGAVGGYQQIASKVSCGEIDLVVFFRDASAFNVDNPLEGEIIKSCDFYNVPLATNIATAEILVRALKERGFS